MSLPYPKVPASQFPAIFNASTLTVEAAARTQPQVGTTFSDWGVKLTMVKITREQQDSQIIEKGTPFIQQGVLQPHTGRRLEIMKEGHRSWNWYILTTTTDLALNIYDEVKINGVLYRVMTQKNFGQYGFFTYNVIRDYDAQPTLGT